MGCARPRLPFLDATKSSRAAASPCRGLSRLTGAVSRAHRVTHERLQPTWAATPGALIRLKASHNGLSCSSATNRPRAPVSLRANSLANTCPSLSSTACASPGRGFTCASISGREALQVFVILALPFATARFRGRRAYTCFGTRALRLVSAHAPFRGGVASESLVLAARGLLQWRVGLRGCVDPLLLIADR